MKIKYSVLLLFAVGMSIFTACNDDFMQQDPIQDMAAGSFLKTESDLPLYLNGLYDKYVEGYQRYPSYDATRSALNVNAPRIIGWDRISDNMVTTGNGSNRLDGTLQTPQSGTGTYWKWENLRSVNYFLRNYTQALPSVSNPSVLNKYVAEARFFKVWDYYEKVLFLGEVPWYQYDLNVNSPELYAPRTPRAELMDSVLWSINYAVNNLEDKYDPTGRINKDMANFLKARVCLFEGTFRKYHTELNMQSSANKFLEDCVTACEAIISTGRYELYKQGSDSYWKIFTFKGTTVSHKEAILARVYDGAKVGHDSQRYYEMNRARGSVGATRNLVDEYLCEDGRPIYIGGSKGNYQMNPLFKGYDGMWTEMDNRDPRLKQTIAKPGEKNITAYDNQTGTYGNLYYPGVTYNDKQTADYGSTVTGYRFVKHWMGDKEEREAISKGIQTAIVFRYAEVLLMLAEAKTILGTITQNDIDLTVNKLRERAGFDFTKYPTAKLTIGNEPADPYLDDINASKLSYPVSPLLREIRRERRIELAQEGFRYEDLMRWKAGNLLTLPLRGVKMTSEKLKIYDGTKAGGVINPTTGVKEYAAGATIGNELFLDSEGFIIPYPKNTKIIQGMMPWDDKRYYFPIPLQELDLNRNLKQNDGWEDIKR